MIPAFATITDDEGARVGADPRTLTKAQLNELGHEKAPLLAVIRAKCLDCCAGSIAEVRRCMAVRCALWPYRMAKNPFREVSEAQRAAGARLARKSKENPSEDLEDDGE